MDHVALTSESVGYRALHESAAWIDLSGRGKIRAIGEDAARLLHAMTTNQVAELQPGEGCYAFFLNAQGRILADANLLCREGEFLLDTEPELCKKIYEHLDRYIIADDVTLENVTEATATISVEGPRAAEMLGQALAKLGASLPETPFAWTAAGEWTVAQIDSTGAGGFFVILPVADKIRFLALLTEAGLPEASSEEARVVRLEHGRPRYGEEITERRLVQETAQLHAVNFTKGCYLGQEIVERVRSQAQVHRHLRKLEIESTVPPEPGTELTAGQASADDASANAAAKAGEVVSSAYSPALQKTVAMAYVRTPYAHAGSELSCAGAVARVSD